MMVKKIMVYLIVLSLLFLVLGCNNQAVPNPESGIVFAIDPNSQTKFDEYELNLKTDEGGFIVVTLKKSDNFQVKWAQSLVDENQGKSFEVLTLQGYNTRKPGDLTEYATPFLLKFENNMTSLGRVVLVKLN